MAMDAKTYCLGALMLGEASGYQIRKLFEDGWLSPINDIGFGSIYPALTALVELGYAEIVAENGNGGDDGRNPDGKGRQEKKTYRITPAGRVAFIVALQQPPAIDRVRSETLFILGFASLLTQGRVRQVLDGYLGMHRQSLSVLEGWAKDLHMEANPSCRFVLGFGQAIHRAAVDYIEQNRALLEQAGTARQDKRCGGLR